MTTGKNEQTVENDGLFVGEAPQEVDLGCGFDPGLEQRWVQTSDGGWYPEGYQFIEWS